MEYGVIGDIKTVMTLLDLSPSGLAEELGVARSTVLRILNKQVRPSPAILERFYSFSYRNHYRPIKLNELKSQFASDEYGRILFHGAKEMISGDVDLLHSRTKIDLGKGFYLGETYAQASAYVYSVPSSSIYIFDSKKLSSLRCKEYDVGFEWMILVCHYRNRLQRFDASPMVKAIVEEAESYDVLIAPIADNNMYDILNRFADGELTDKQTMTALSASSLGKQHVLKTPLAVSAISVVDRLYLSIPEREEINEAMKQNALISSDKYRLAIESLRRKGKYIEEIFNE